MTDINKSRIVRLARSFWPVFAVILTFLIGQLVAVLLAVLPLIIFGYSGQELLVAINDSTLLKFVIFTLAQVIQILIIKWIMKRKNITLQGLGFTKPRWQHLLMGALGFGIYMLAITVGLGILALIINDPSMFDQEQSLGFSKSITGIGLFLVAAQLVFITPIVEEFVMRGFLYQSLKINLPLIVSAFVVSALFAVAHIQVDPTGQIIWLVGVDTFVMSFAAIWLIERFKSIWPAVALHFYKNSLAFVFIFIIRN